MERQTSEAGVPWVAPLRERAPSHLSRRQHGIVEFAADAELGHPRGDSRGAARRVRQDNHLFASGAQTAHRIACPRKRADAVVDASPKIEQHGVKGLHPPVMGGLFQIAGFVDAVPGIAQAQAHDLAQHGIVFDQQDSHGHELAAWWA